MYRTYYDELGDEVVEFVEGEPWSLPDFYRENEAIIAAQNIEAGHCRSDLAISRNTLHAAVQLVRRQTLGWGMKFANDPRRFSGGVR